MSPIDWDALLDAFAGRKILVVGDVMLDEYLWGDVRRICPEAPVPIVETLQRTARPGGAGNTAANVAALGASVALYGVVGPDEAAEQLRDALVRAGVRTNLTPSPFPAKEGEPGTGTLLVSADRPTTTKLRVIAHQQQVIRIDSEHSQPIPEAVAAQLAREVDSLMPGSDALLLCDYAKGVFSAATAAHLIQSARKARIPAIVDPKGTDYLRYRGATIVKPNMHELEAWSRRPIRSTADLHHAGAQFMRELDGSGVLVTQGSAGMTLFRPGADPWHQPAAPRAVYDVTGAGDTVVGVLALALACRAPLTQAVQLANIAAGIVVGKLGTSVATPAELRVALASDPMATKSLPLEMELNGVC